MSIRVYHSTSLTRIWFGSCWCPCLSWRPSTSKFSIFVTNDYERQNLVIMSELSRGRVRRQAEVVLQLRRGGTSWSTSWSSAWSCSRRSLWLKKWRSFYNTNSKEYVYDERRRTWRRRCMYAVCDGARQEAAGSPHLLFPAWPLQQPCKPIQVALLWKRYDQLLFFLTKVLCELWPGWLNIKWQEQGGGKGVAGVRWGARSGNGWAPRAFTWLCSGTGSLTPHLMDILGWWS